MITQGIAWCTEDREEWIFDEVAHERFAVYPTGKREPVEGLHWGVIQHDNGALVFQFSES